MPIRLLALLLFSLTAVACGEDPAPADGTDKSDGDDDDGDDGDADGDDADGDDADGDDGTKGELDGGTTKMDSGKTPPSSDSSVNPQADAGTQPGKTDAAVKPDSGQPPVNPTRAKPKCVKKPSQVMVIGDSYINWITHTFPADMAAEAGETWRMEAIGAYSMGSGGAGFIPDQYRGSIMRDPDAHTILMDGGGNDLLVADPTLDFFGACKTVDAPTIENCQIIIDKAIAAADKLLTESADDGIRDVVYFFYPHVPKGTLLGGPNPNAMLDHALPQVKKFCEGVEEKTKGKTRCTFVDMVPVFEGHDDWFVPGDIHETSDGSKAMAKELWKVMKDKCIAQPSGSGCCEE